MGILFRAKYKEEPYFGGKYFRIVGRLIADGVDISDLLIQRHLAVLYEWGEENQGLVWVTTHGLLSTFCQVKKAL